MGVPVEVYLGPIAARLRARCAEIEDLLLAVHLLPAHRREESQH